MSNSVSKVSQEVEAMLSLSAPVRDLVEGGAHMRDLGVKYLPQFPQETDDDYNARVASSWLFDGVGKTIEDLSGKVFDQPVMLAETNTDLDVWAFNIDLEARDLSQFSKDVFSDAQRSGISFIMVDAPLRDVNLTKAQALQGNFRPYFVHLRLEDVLGWKWEIINNAPKLTQIRIMERVATESTDEFVPDKSIQIRVLTLPVEEKRIIGTVNVRIYCQNERDDWYLHEEYGTGMTEIMVKPVDIGRKSFFNAEPPHSRLAEINLAHWRSQSDQANIMHHARAPMKYFHGYSREDLQAFTEGAGYAFWSSNENAKIGVVEHSGAAIDAGRTELKDMEFQMQAMGLQLIVSRSGTTTATGDMIDENKINSRLSMWADTLKDSLETCFSWMADLSNINAEIEITINKDYSATAMSHIDMDSLNKMHLAGVISKQTYIEEAKRRGILAENVDAEDEIEMVADQSMDMPDDVII
tara:strand:- start:13195 stop:14601 length:1407 start_codon:yes stop_codon:yes gene_type:complete